jgi:hypothetical protein
MLSILVARFYCTLKHRSPPPNVTCLHQLQRFKLTRLLFKPQHPVEIKSGALARISGFPSAKQL